MITIAVIAVIDDDRNIMIMIHVLIEYFDTAILTAMRIIKCNNAGRFVMVSDYDAD